MSYKLDDTSSHCHSTTPFRNLLVSIAKTTELLLASSVPNVELDRTATGVELEGIYFHTEGGWQIAWKR